MARLTEEMVIARSKQSDLSAIKKLNCWGAELGDVTLLRRMPNVEVLALSINKIRTLCDFAACRRLRELYVRKNEIRDLNEIRYLRQLPELTSLWLDENPCTQHPQYRMTVLRNLPNLEKLDNVPVHPDEVQEAMRRGDYIPDSDDEGYPQQETYSEGYPVGDRSVECSPEREPDQFYRHAPVDQVSEGATDAGSERTEQPEQYAAECRLSPPRRDERYDNPAAAMTRSHYEPRAGPLSPESGVPHSFSAHCVKQEYSSNGDARHSPPQPPDRDYDRSEYCSASQRCNSEVWERDRDMGPRERERDTNSAREYPSAVMAEHRGFTRRPVTRNSNLLSALLCLVKELDYPSLEVAEMAVRCRMDELANSQ